MGLSFIYSYHCPNNIFLLIKKWIYKINHSQIKQPRKKICKMTFRKKPNSWICTRVSKLQFLILLKLFLVSHFAYFAKSLNFHLEICFCRRIFFNRSFCDLIYVFSRLFISRWNGVCFIMLKNISERDAYIYTPSSLQNNRLSSGNKISSLRSSL